VSRAEQILPGGVGLSGPAPVAARPRRHVPFVAAFVTLVLAAPVLAGLAGVILPALGYMPALGARDMGVQPFRDLVAWPGFAPSLWLSLRVGVTATVLSLLISLLICASLHRTRLFRALVGQLSVLLAIPHAAAALGLAFVMLPSGWIARALSPWLTGWNRAPDLLTVNDPAGIALIAGLMIKEIPFLMLMILAALGQVRADQGLATAGALGYRPITAWMKTVLPGVYGQIRLPVFAVLAFSLSVVDMALILGPNTPPPLAVQVVRWMNDPDLAMRLQAAAGAVVQLALVLGALALWRMGEIAVAAMGRAWVYAGGRGVGWVELWARLSACILAIATSATMGLGILGLAVWSFAGLWSFPDFLPDQFTLRSWLRHGPGLGPLAADTVVIAGASTLIALAMTITCLQTEDRLGKTPGRGAMWLLYLPLVVPQVSFLGGLQVFGLGLGLRGNVPTVIAAHLVFVLPYVFLTLASPWRAWDARYATVAHALGSTRAGVFWRVRLPMLLPAVLTSVAVGFSVSVGQYLATLLIGGGRVQTLTTEAVALAAGGDRRVIGVTALAQTAVAVAPFALALIIPRLVRPGRGRRA